MTANSKRVLTLNIVVLLTSCAISQEQRWVLPVADGGSQPSPPSVHGYLVKVARNTIVVQRDTRSKKAVGAVTVELKTKTDFFTAYGGPYNPDRLRSGQYVWVWYVTADPTKAGTPPAAAVVILWSKDPSDKPSQKVRWSYDVKQSKH